MSLIGLLTATKTSPPKLAPYEAHTVALEEQQLLEDTRITRKGDTSPQVVPLSLKMVAGGKQCAHRSTITPTKICSADLYRHIKRKVGRSLKRTHCRGTCSLPDTKLHINHLALNAVFLALKEFQYLCLNNIVLVATDNTTVVVLYKQRRKMKFGPL